MVGLAGLLPKKPVAAVILSSAARLLVHVISGVVIWGQWMPDEFLGLQMTNVWFYSFLYNGTFMAGTWSLPLSFWLFWQGAQRLHDRDRDVIIPVRFYEKRKKRNEKRIDTIFNVYI